MCVRWLGTVVDCVKAIFGCRKPSCLSLRENEEGRGLDREVHGAFVYASGGNSCCQYDHIAESKSRGHVFSCEKSSVNSNSGQQCRAGRSGRISRKRPCYYANHFYR